MSAEQMAAVRRNLAIFREEPEFAALQAYMSAQAMEMNLENFAQAVVAAVGAPPEDCEVVEVLMAALAIQLADKDAVLGPTNVRFALLNCYLLWLQPQNSDLAHALKAFMLDRRLVLPKLQLVIPALDGDHLSEWHQARVSACQQAFKTLRRGLRNRAVPGAFSRRVDEALVLGMYLEGREFPQAWSDTVLRHVLLGWLIEEAHFRPSEYLLLLTYLSWLFARLPLPQATRLLATLQQVAPLVLKSVQSKRWFSTQKVSWLDPAVSPKRPAVLLDEVTLAQRRGIASVYTNEGWQPQLAPAVGFAHVDAENDYRWNRARAALARNVIVRRLQALDTEAPIVLPGVSHDALFAGAVLVADLMYAEHVQALNRWQPAAFKAVLDEVLLQLQPEASAHLQATMRYLLPKLRPLARWNASRLAALEAVLA